MYKVELSEGVSSVARRQRKSMSAVEDELAAILGFSSHTIEYWRRGHLPADEELVAALVRFCAEKGRVNREWAVTILHHARYRGADSLLPELFPVEGDPRASRPHLFMCYLRGVEPDDTLALRLARTFSRTHSVFFDQALSGDQAWGSEVARELERAQFVIFLLSASAVESEVVRAQAEWAHTLSAKREGGPRLLPVRVAFRAPFPTPLNTCFDSLKWAYWRDDSNTGRLIAELQDALSGQELPIGHDGKRQLVRPATPAVNGAPPASATPMEAPEGTMAPDSRYYIERETDAIAQAAINQAGVTVTIKGPRQVGKSSLLIRLQHSARTMGKRVVYIDFQLLKSVLADAETFFRQFCRLITFQVGLEDRTEDLWTLPLPNTFRATEYMARHLLGKPDRQLVLTMDEVETVFASGFRTDFFGMLRNWHNNRAFDPVWKRLDLTLVTSTEPYFFIDNLNQSPFNVGTVVELRPFTNEQLSELNRRHGAPLAAAEVAGLHRLLHGHPYLTRRALYLVATGQLTAGQLFSRTTAADGPFADHLRALLLRLHEREQLVPALRQIVLEQRCDDELAFFRLRGAGLVRRHHGAVFPANELYATFLEEYFHE